MFSEDDKNVTSIFEVPNIDKEGDNTESDNYESDNDTITTTDAIADVTELNMLDELSINKSLSYYLLAIKSTRANKCYCSFVLFVSPTQHGRTTRAKTTNT